MAVSCLKAKNDKKQNNRDRQKMIDLLDRDTIGIVLSYLSVHEALFILPFLNRSLFQTITRCHSLLDSHLHDHEDNNSEREENLSSDDCAFPIHHFEQQLLMRITHEPFRSNLLSKMKSSLLSYWEMVDLYDDLVAPFNYQSLMDQIEDAQLEKEKMTSVIRRHIPFHFNWIVQSDGSSTRLTWTWIKSQAVVIQLTNMKPNTKLTRGVYCIRGVLRSIVLEKDNTLRFVVSLLNMSRFEPQMDHIDMHIDDQTDLYAMNICKGCSLDEIQSTTHQVIKFTAYMFYIASAYKDRIVLQIHSNLSPSEWRLIDVTLDPLTKKEMDEELWGDLEIIGVIEFNERNSKSTISPLSIIRLSQPEQGYISRFINTVASFMRNDCEPYQKVLYVHPSFHYK